MNNEQSDSICDELAESKSNLPLSDIDPAMKINLAYSELELPLPKSQRLLMARLAVSAPIFFSLALHFGHLLILGPSLLLPFILPFLSKAYS